jgi:hypothetical protein
MRCSFDRLIEYLNNSLSESQTHDVFTHLQNCEICLEAVATMLQDRQIADPSSALVEEHSSRLVEACHR